MNDAEMELRMGRVLQWGVTAAALVMAVGGGIFLSRHGGEIPDYKNFHGVLPPFKSVREGRALIQLGVLLMIATPVFRVIYAIWAFAVERDWLYTAVSGIVLALLAYALFWSL